MTQFCWRTSTMAQVSANAKLAELPTSSPPAMESWPWKAGPEIAEPAPAPELTVLSQLISCHCRFQLQSVFSTHFRDAAIAKSPNTPVSPLGLLLENDQLQLQRVRSELSIMILHLVDITCKCKQYSNHIMQAAGR